MRDLFHRHRKSAMFYRSQTDAWGILLSHSARGNPRGLDECQFYIVNYSYTCIDILHDRDSKQPNPSLNLSPVMIERMENEEKKRKKKMILRFIIYSYLNPDGSKARNLETECARPFYQVKSQLPIINAGKSGEQCGKVEHELRVTPSHTHILSCDVTIILYPAP